MSSQRDVQNRIASVQNIRKITRAMEMVAAARLRRAEQRIEALRPYADAIRRMTRRASEAAENIPSLPILLERESVARVGVLVVTGDRGESSLIFRGLDLAQAWTGFTERPAFADARRIADGLTSAYVDEKVDRVEVIYNGFISAVRQEVRHETLLPLQQA